MRFHIVDNPQTVLRLRPLAQEWLEECNCKEFGMDADIDKHLTELASLVERSNADLILLINNDEEIAGYMGVEWFVSPLGGGQKIANEHYWYVAREFRGASARIIKAAADWAKAMGCSHLIMNASNMASDLHDKVCRLYEHSGFRRFETSYIKEIK